MLTQKVDHREIYVKDLYFLITNLTHLQIRKIHDWAPHGSRDHFISPQEVARMGRSIENDKICLHPEDAISTKVWVDKLKSDNTRTFTKIS